MVLLSPSYALIVHLKQSHQGTVRVTTPHERTDCLAFTYFSDMRSLSLYSIVDAYYARLAFKRVPLASADLSCFSLRTYQHLAGSMAQVMISHTPGRHSFFVEDRETVEQQTIREALTTASLKREIL